MLVTNRALALVLLLCLNQWLRENEGATFAKPHNLLIPPSETKVPEGIYELRTLSRRDIYDCDGKLDLLVKTLWPSIEEDWAVGVLI